MTQGISAMSLTRTVRCLSMETINEVLLVQLGNLHLVQCNTWIRFSLRTNCSTHPKSRHGELPSRVATHIDPTLSEDVRRISLGMPTVALIDTPGCPDPGVSGGASAQIGSPIVAPRAIETHRISQCPMNSMNVLTFLQPMFGMSGAAGFFST